MEGQFPEFGFRNSESGMKGCEGGGRWGGGSVSFDRGGDDHRMQPAFLGVGREFIARLHYNLRREVQGGPHRSGPR